MGGSGCTLFHFQQYQSHGSAGVLHRIMTARRGFNILHTDSSRGRRRGRIGSLAVLPHRSSGRSGEGCSFMLLLYVDVKVIGCQRLVAER